MGGGGGGVFWEVSDLPRPFRRKQYIWLGLMKPTSDLCYPGMDDDERARRELLCRDGKNQTSGETQVGNDAMGYWQCTARGAGSNYAYHALFGGKGGSAGQLKKGVDSHCRYEEDVTIASAMGPNGRWFEAEADTIIFSLTVDAQPS